jgi:hypothetical protein
MGDEISCKKNICESLKFFYPLCRPTSNQSDELKSLQEQVFQLKNELEHFNMLIRNK